MSPETLLGGLYSIIFKNTFKDGWKYKTMRYTIALVIFSIPILFGLGIWFHHQETMKKLQIQEEIVKKTLPTVIQKGGKIKFTNSGVEVEIPSQK